jgi:methylated-DNA-[protein]-cysteine S-methyltransferase
MPAPLKLAYAAFPSALGWMAICGQDKTLYGLSFGHDTASRALAALKLDKLQAVERANWNRGLQSRLQDYADGAPVDFLDVLIEVDRSSEFIWAVIERCRRIPFGETLSYGKLAEAVGYVGAARAVGNVMRSNCVPLVVPCHRVVLAGGKIGNFSAPSGRRMKERLLRMEIGHTLSLV